MTRILLVGLAALAVSAAASAQHMQIQFAEPVDIPDRAGDVSFDAYGRRFALSLEGNDRLMQSLSGARKAELASARPLRGRLPGVPGSWVRLARVDGALEGAIWDGAELYVVSSAARIASHLTTPLAVGDDQTVVYRLSDTLNALPEAFCGIDRDLPRSPAIERGSALKQYQSTVAALRAAADVTLTDQLEISLIADPQFQSMHSGHAAETMVARLNVVDGIFAEQVGVLLVPAELRLLTAGHPFSAPEAETLLEQLANYRQDTPAVRAPGLAHLFTGRPVVGGTLGMAFIGAVCDPRRGVSLTFAESTGIRTALVMAHEIGHNFGAEHDGIVGRACESTWPSYLMSPTYSVHGTTFSQCSLDTMAPVIARARGVCLAPPSYVDVSVAAPSSIFGERLDEFSIPFTITSTGNRAAANVSLDLEVPFGLSVLRTEGFGACVPVAEAMRCPAGNLAAGEERVVEVRFVGSAVTFYNGVVRVRADNDYLPDEASFQVQLRSNIDLTSTIGSTPATVYAGDPFEVHVDVISLRSGVARGARLDLSINATDVPEGIVAGPHSCSFDAPARRLTCNLADLAPRSTSRISFTMRSSFTGGIGLTSNVVATDDGDNTNNFFHGGVNVRRDREVLTTGMPDFAAVIGDPYDITFTLTTAGRFPIDGEMFVYPPFQGLGVIESLTPSAGTCEPVDPAAVLIRCTFGTLSPGDVRTVTARIRMTQSGESFVQAMGRFVYNGDISYTMGTTRVRAALPVDAEATGGQADSITEGFSGQGIVRLRSHGASSAQDLVATLDAPAGIQLTAFDNYGPSPLTCAIVTAQRARCTGTLGYNDHVQVQYRYTSSSVGSHALTFTAVAPGDSNAANDRADIALEVLPFLDVGITGPTARVDLEVGQVRTVPFTLTAGTRAVPGVRIYLPSNSSFEVESVNGSGVLSCLPVVNPTSCELGDLAAGTSVSVNVNLRALRENAGGTFGASAWATRDSNSANNYASVSYLTFAMTDARLEVDGATVSAQGGTRFQFPTLRVSSGAAFARDVVVEIPLPAFTTIDTVSASAWCSGTTTLRCDFGVMGAGESRGINLWLRSDATAAGTFTSNITLRASNDTASNNNAVSVAMTVTAPPGSSSSSSSSSGGVGSSSSSSSSGGGKGGGGSLDWFALLLLALPAVAVLTRRSKFRCALHDSITRRESGVMSRADR